jgi:hypothetical protein
MTEPCSTYTHYNYSIKREPFVPLSSPLTSLASDMVAITSGKLLITGGSGYIGAWIVKSAVDHGYSVVAAYIFHHRYLFRVDRLMGRLPLTASELTLMDNSLSIDSLSIMERYPTSSSRRSRRCRLILPTSFSLPERTLTRALPGWCIR